MKVFYSVVINSEFTLILMTIPVVKTEINCRKCNGFLINFHNIVALKNNQPTDLNDINHIISKFTPVSLEEIDEVKLMSRIDRKYWFHLSKLQEILEQTLSEYHILEIGGHRLMDYQTTYFDTTDNLMYLKHHNGKTNRHKIRQRKYVSTDTSFLEVKFKTNKKITVKNRIKSVFERESFLMADSVFIKHETPYSTENLIPVLRNKFRRLTLIHKDRLDRCTIDISPVFWNVNDKIKLNDLAIFELKRGHSLKSSPIVSMLRNLKIRQRGMSKYCTGRAMLEPGLKQNAFKPRLRFLTKEILN